MYKRKKSEQVETHEKYIVLAKIIKKYEAQPLRGTVEKKKLCYIQPEYKL